MTPFNDTERLVIELADAMAETPSNVSDDLYARLRAINSPKNNYCSWEGRSPLRIIVPVSIESSTSRATIYTPPRSDGFLAVEEMRRLGGVAPCLLKCRSNPARQAQLCFDFLDKIAGCVEQHEREQILCSGPNHAKENPAHREH